MPTNRRPNNQPVRRPKVAGLRKRRTHNEELLAEARSAGSAEQSEAAAERGEAVAERGEPVAERAVERGEAVAERAVERGEAVAERAGVNGAVAERGEAAAEDSAVGGAPEVSAEHGEAVTERVDSSGAPAEPGGAAEAGSERGEADAESRWAAATAEPEAESAFGAALREADGKSAPQWPLWAATVVLIGLAGWFGFEAYSARYTGAAANEAMVSAGATSEVSGQVSDAVEKLFSYDFNDTAKTEAAAKELLTGAAVQRYEELFAVVKQQAPQQQLIVTTTVKERSVTRLQGDRAELLLFVDQHARRANAPGENAGPAQISVSAEKQGDAWKISQITLR